MIRQFKIVRVNTDYCDYLRKYEKTNGYIIIQAIKGTGIETGIMNRLIKSSHGKII